MKISRLMAASLLTGIGLTAQAQVPGVHRTDLVQHDLTALAREGLQVRVDFNPGWYAPLGT